MAAPILIMLGPGQWLGPIGVKSTIDDFSSFHLFLLRGSRLSSLEPFCTSSLPQTTDADYNWIFFSTLLSSILAETTEED